MARIIDHNMEKGKNIFEFKIGDLVKLVIYINNRPYYSLSAFKQIFTIKHKYMVK